MFFVIIILQPNISFSCSYCVESMFYYLFPFMYYAIFILTIWRIVYAIWQYNKAHPPIKTIIKAVALRLLLIFLLYFGFRKAVFFLYLISSFIKAIYLFLKDLIKKTEIRYKKSLYIIHTTTTFFLLTILIYSYIQSSKIDTLEKLRHYIHPGTGFGRQFVQQIANDKNFNLNRLKELILSGNMGDRERAFEILYVRKSFDDLVYFQDIILNLKYLESSLSQNWTKESSGWLYLWLDSLGVKDIKTKEELKNWIEKEKLK